MERDARAAACDRYLADRDQDQADIVRAASRQRVVEQAVGDRVERAVQTIEQVRIGLAARQPVRAEQIEVAGCDGDRATLDRDIGGRAECAGDDMGLGMAMSLFGCERTRIDQFLDEAVIPAELLDAAGAEPIGAAVACPEHHPFVPVDVQRDYRRSADPCRSAGLGMDAPARPVQRGIDHAIVEVPTTVDERAQRIDDPLRRDVTREMAAHAVGDRPQAAFGAIEDAILVDRADAADMRARDRANASFLFRDRTLGAPPPRQQIGENHRGDRLACASAAS